MSWLHHLGIVFVCQISRFTSRGHSPSLTSSNLGLSCLCYVTIFFCIPQFQSKNALAHVLSSRRTKKGSSLKKIMPLIGMTIGNFPDDENISYGFEVFHPNLRDETITIVCESQQEKDEWLSDLRNYIRKATSASDSLRKIN